MSLFCSICCNDTFGRTVVCQFCKNEKDGAKIITCVECSKRYLLEEMTEAKCMICKRQWPNAFIYNTFSKTFLHGAYRKHLKKVWVERETSLIPSTLPFVHAKQKIYGCSEEIAKAHIQIDSLESQIRELKKHISKLESQKTECTLFISDCGINENDFSKIDLLMPCPKENCNGLVEKSNSKCVACGTVVCSKCFELSHDSQCDENKVLSANDINKNTRPCPKCATRIYKLEGCDMMFCTNCKMAFSWAKGSILNGPIHNPHYFEWQQRLAEETLRNSTFISPANNNFPNCGEIPDYIIHFFRHFTHIVPDYEKYSDYINKVKDLIRSVTHYQSVEIPWYVRETTINHEVQMRHLRIFYVLGKIDRDNFVKSILIYERKKQKAIIIRDIIRSFNTVCIDYLQILVRYLITTSSTLEKSQANNTIITEVVGKIRETMEQIDTLRDEANESLKNECLLIGFTSCPILRLKGLESVSISLPSKRKYNSSTPE